MFKKLACVLLAVLLLTITGCNSSKEINNDTDSEEETLKEVPAGFTNGYEEAEFDKLNSPAEENGLGGLKVYKYGILDEISTLTVEAGNMWYATFNDEDGNKWLISLEAETWGNKETYDAIVGHEVVVDTYYGGFSETYQLPTVHLIKLFDRNTGNIISSGLGNNGYEETYGDKKDNSETSDSKSNNATEDNSNTSKVENTDIRPEVKEAIDNYESFIDKYCEFMEKYQNSTDTSSMLLDYTSMCADLLNWSNKMDSLEGDMTDAESNYYTEVLLRTSAKMAKLGLSQ